MKSERTCIACRAKKNKKDLLRIVKNQKGEITIDNDQKGQGRGAYICNSKSCIDKVIKSKSLNRSYKMAIGSDIYQKIGELCDK